MGIRAIDALDMVPASIVTSAGAEWGLADAPGGDRLVVVARSADVPWRDEIEGDIVADRDRLLVVGPASCRNAAALRKYLPWLTPRPIGLRTSAGLGDRLGLATPGHIDAIRATGSTIAPVLAQQSIREMTRTGRTPQEVIDDAVWGAFRSGWQKGLGADGDHLKTVDDIDRCVAAGYSLFTFDPGGYVKEAAERASDADLSAWFAALPWSALEDTPADLERRYVGRRSEIERHTIAFDRAMVIKAAVKYGAAVAHVTALYRHLEQVAESGFEVEVSVDETDAPTTHAEHVYIASELRRLGVRWVSLAPRFVGRFEKGVDYLGDPASFETDCAVHAAIARVMGPYKLSLHSGSDKFSIYAIAAREARGLVHLKTAGTSYLEALRTLAVVEPPLLRAIYEFARARYDTDKASYHVSALLDRAPDVMRLADGDLRVLLDDFDARQVLHVTFGSVLTARAPDGAWLFRDRLLSALRANRVAYAADLEAHFVRHLRPFAQAVPAHQAD